MTCLDNIIGLSETTCNCEGIPPVNYNQSLSGIFLDQLEGIDLRMNTGADDCEDGLIWDRMTRAIRNAKNEFTSDLMACVQQTYKARQDNWSGLLGDTLFNAAVNPLTPYAGIKITPLNLKGAYLTIKRIGLLVNTTTPVTVRIYSDENNSTLIATYIINAVANVLTYAVIAPTGLELPMWSYNKSQINYYALLDLTPASFLPLNNKKSCNCGGANTKPYLNWLDFFGGKITNTADFNTFLPSTANELNGIVLDVDIKCKLSQIICTDEEPLDFENDGYAKKIAYAIRFKAGEILLNDLLSSTNINRFTLMDREKITAYVSYYRGEYNKWIDFLCQNVQMNNNSCFICKNNNGLVKTRLLV